MWVRRARASDDHRWVHFGEPESFRHDGASFLRMSRRTLGFLPDARFPFRVERLEPLRRHFCHTPGHSEAPLGAPRTFVTCHLLGDAPSLEPR